MLNYIDEEKKKEQAGKVRLKLTPKEDETNFINSLEVVEDGK